MAESKMLTDLAYSLKPISKDGLNNILTGIEPGEN
jgi:hypothetical protein